MRSSSHGGAFSPLRNNAAGSMTKRGPDLARGNPLRNRHSKSRSACATFAYRHLAIKCLIGEYLHLRPRLIDSHVEAIEELRQH